MAAPRIVAELGRPETPAETAARKAESSRVHRASRTTRNLIAALLATLAVVAVIIAAVPRGELPPADDIDVAAIAEGIAQSRATTVIVPEMPSSWGVNRARISGDSVPAWTIVYVPPRGFLRVAQGFGADPAWPSRVLSGASPDGTVTIDGVTWDTYSPDPDRAGNVSYALSTNAGPDIVMIYGSTDAETAATAAAGVADQVRELQEENR